MPRKSWQSTFWKIVERRFESRWSPPGELIYCYTQLFSQWQTSSSFKSMLVLLFDIKILMMIKTHLNFLSTLALFLQQFLSWNDYSRMQHPQNDLRQSVEINTCIWLLFTVFSIQTFISLLIIQLSKFSFTNFNLNISC